MEPKTNGGAFDGVPPTTSAPEAPETATSKPFEPGQVLPGLSSTLVFSPHAHMYQQMLMAQQMAHSNYMMAGSPWMHPNAAMMPFSPMYLPPFGQEENLYRHASDISDTQKNDPSQIKGSRDARDASDPQAMPIQPVTLVPVVSTARHMRHQT